MSLPRIVIGLFLLQLSLSIQGQYALPSIIDSIHSGILNETRELRIILPKGYASDSPNRYEVLYILDGEWYEELVPFSYNFAESAGYLPKSIFVLVRNRYSSGRNLRDRDFSPTHVANDSLSGGADRFYDFLTKEVVPYIEHKYPASGQRSLIGSSFSGLFSVYAFLKDPEFFQSFIASDPNINFDQHFVTRLAVKTLPRFSRTPGTLFIAGRTHSYREGGIFGFDSVLKAYAPETLHWRCIPYENETHYSVQLKAFYEGLRFSHYGYPSGPPEFHPMNGMVSANKSFIIYFLNNNPSARFTRDGSEPIHSSALMIRDDTVTMTAPGQLRIKTFANRPAYVKEWTGNFTTGQLFPEQTKNKKVKTGLTYQVFDGRWDSIPEINSLVPTKSGVVDSLIKMNVLLQQRSAFLLMEGTINITEDAEYVFYINGFDAAQLTVGGKLFFKDESIFHNQVLSYIVSLKRGKYPLRLILLHKSQSLESHFSVYRSTAGNKRWWENRLLDF